MPAEVIVKAKALRAAMDILEARIRYNKALIDDLHASTIEELRDFFYNYSPNTRGIIENYGITPAGLELNVNNLRDNIIRGAYADIAQLSRVAGYVQKFAEGTINCLELVYALHANIVYETAQVKNTEQKRKQRITQIRASSLPRLQIEEKVAAEKESYGDQINRSELFVYQSVLDILSCNGILTAREEEFIQSYCVLAYETSPIITLTLTDKFSRLLNRNYERFDAISKKIADLSEFHVDLKSEMQQQIAIINEEHAKCAEYYNKPKDYLLLSQSQREMCQTYEKAYTHKLQISDLENKIKRSLAEEAKWREESQRQREFAARQAKHLEFIKQQELLKQQQKSSEQNRKLLAERQAALQAMIALEIEQEEQRKQDHILANIRYKQLVAADRVKRDLEKQHERIKLVQEIKLSQNIYSDDRGILKSKYTIEDSVASANISSIATLLAAKSYSYKDAVNLIKRLGGNVDDSTGSAHHKVIFGGATYQFIEDQEKSKLVAGLPRPHEGESKLRRFELTLLKDVISIVLSEKMLALLAVPKSKLGMEYI